MNRLREALASRLTRLPPETTCYRWVDGEIPDLTVDRFGPVAVMSLYSGTHDEEAWAQALASSSGIESVYVKRRPKEARNVANVAPETIAPPLPLQGPAREKLVVKECGAQFEIRPSNGLSVGLYLDSRDARQWVREHASGRRVLNCFAYTCGFAVAAHLGGARRAVNLDLSRKVLDWGQRNLELNGFAPERRDFIAGDTFEWLHRFAKKREQFDLVILDPPGFATSGQSRFSAVNDYHRLVSAAEAVVAPGGLLLAMCNVAQLAPKNFEQHLVRGLRGRAGREVARFGASDIDFAQPGALKCFAWELGAPLARSGE